MIPKKLSSLLKYLIVILIVPLMIQCSYRPPEDKIDEKSEEIGLYEEWLMGLIAINNTKTKLYNPKGNLNRIERKFRFMLKRLHYSSVNLNFWRETYFPPELVIYRSRAKNAFTLPGGFICLTTGIMNHIYRESRKKKVNGDQVMAGILAHELIHLYLEHPKRHYVTMLLKNNISRQYREMAEGIQAASGDFQNDYTKLIIKTILKAKSQGIKGYQANMEAEADVKGVDVMFAARYHPKGLYYALGMMKHHMGGVHGSYEDRAARVIQAIQKYGLSVKK